MNSINRANVNVSHRIALENPFLASYKKRTPKSRALFQRSQTKLPGGNTRAAVYFQPYPLYLGRGKGYNVWDIDGNRYVDFHNNYTALILGHANPGVVRAVRERVADGTCFGAPSEYEYALAELVSKRMQSIDKMRFCNSGTEATMYSLLTAKAFTGRTRILKFEGAYHGTHESALVSTHPPAGSGYPIIPIPDVAGVSPSVLNDVLVARFNDQESVERVFRDHGKELAALIVEPVMGSAGMIPAKKEFLKLLRELCTANDVLLIFDEVITGFRLSMGGAQEYYGVAPDLTALGKNLGGGFPVGGYGGREDVMGLFDIVKVPKITLSGTFSANPVTMAAGLATLRQLNAATYQRLDRMGKSLQNVWEQAISDSHVPAVVSRAGSLLNIHFTRNEVVDYQSAKAEDSSLKSAFFLGMVVSGIFMAARGMAAISVPMSNSEIKAFAKAADQTFAMLRKL